MNQKSKEQKCGNFSLVGLISFSLYAVIEIDRQFAFRVNDFVLFLVLTDN